MCKKLQRNERKSNIIESYKRKNEAENFARTLKPILDSVPPFCKDKDEYLVATGQNMLEIWRLNFSKWRVIFSKFLAPEMTVDDVHGDQIMYDNVDFTQLTAIARVQNNKQQMPTEATI